MIFKGFFYRRYSLCVFIASLFDLKQSQLYIYIDDFGKENLQISQYRVKRSKLSNFDDCMQNNAVISRIYAGSIKHVND